MVLVPTALPVVASPSSMERLPRSNSSSSSSLVDRDATGNMSPAHRVIVLTGHTLDSQGQVNVDLNIPQNTESQIAIPTPDSPSSTQSNTSRQENSLPASSSRSSVVVLVRDAASTSTTTPSTSASPAPILDSQWALTPDMGGPHSLTPRAPSRPHLRSHYIVGPTATRSGELDPNDPNTDHGRVVAAREAAGTLEARRIVNPDTTDTRPTTPTASIPSSSSNIVDDGSGDPLARFFLTSGANYAANAINEYHRMRLTHHRPTDPVLNRVQDATRDGLLARRSLDNAIAALSTGLANALSGQSRAPPQPSSSVPPQPTSSSISPPSTGDAEGANAATFQQPIISPPSPRAHSTSSSASLSMNPPFPHAPASRASSNSSMPSSLSMSLENFTRQSHSPTSRASSGGSLLSRLPSMNELGNFSTLSRTSTSLTGASLAIMSSGTPSSFGSVLSQTAATSPSSSSWMHGGPIHAEPESLAEQQEDVQTEVGSVDSASVNATDGSVEGEPSSTVSGGVTRVSMPPVREGASYRVVRHIGPDGQEHVASLRVVDEAVIEGSRGAQNPFFDQDQPARPPPVTSLFDNSTASSSAVPQQSPIPTPSTPRLQPRSLAPTPSVSGWPSLDNLGVNYGDYGPTSMFGDSAIGLVLPHMPAYEYLARSHPHGQSQTRLPPPPPTEPLLDANGDSIELPQAPSPSSQDATPPPIDGPLIPIPLTSYVRSPLGDDLRSALEAGRAFRIPRRADTTTSRGSTNMLVGRNSDANASNTSIGTRRIPPLMTISTNTTPTRRRGARVWAANSTDSTASSPSAASTVIGPEDSGIGGATDGGNGLRSGKDEDGDGGNQVQLIGSSERFVPYPLPMPLSGMVDRTAAATTKKLVWRVGHGANFAGR